MNALERATLKQMISDARQAQVRASGFEGCSKCGCDLEDRTYGCRTCMSRHSRRRRFGYGQPKVCGGCQGDWDELTPGCKTCRERSKRRGLGRNGTYERAA